MKCFKNAHFGVCSFCCHIASHAAKCESSKFLLDGWLALDFYQAYQSVQNGSLGQNKGCLAPSPLPPLPTTATTATTQFAADLDVMGFLIGAKNNYARLFYKTAQFVYST